MNDANPSVTETMDNARYPLELFQRVILALAMETMEIVNALPLWISHNEYDVINVGAPACCAQNLPHILHVPWHQMV